MVRVRLICSSSGEHLSQIYSGFALLAATGEVEVTLTRATTYDPGINGNVLRVEVQGARVVYDLRDHGSCLEDELRWADVYFKRSYLAGKPEAHVHPLGLNYPVYVTGDWRWRRAYWSILRLRPGNWRDAGARVARLLGLPVNGGRHSSLADAFEESPMTVGAGVLLLTRAWHQDRETTEFRAACIRALRSHLGPSVVAGFEPTEYARQRYPDLTLDGSLTKKRAYIEKMKSSAVCIATSGLKQSNGWRLAEYAAASRLCRAGRDSS